MTGNLRTFFFVVVLSLASAGSEAGPVFDAIDCTPMGRTLADYAASDPEPLIIEEGAEARKRTEWLRSYAADRLSPLQRSSLPKADFVLGIPVNQGDVIQFFWGGTADKRLCGMSHTVQIETRLVPGFEGYVANQRELTLLEQKDSLAEQLNDSQDVEPAEDDVNQIRAADLLTQREREQLARIAGGVTAYEQTKDACFYERPVGPAVQTIDNAYKQKLGSYWGTMKRDAAGFTNIVQSLGPMMQSENAERIRRQKGLGPSLGLDQCKAAGLAVPHALTAATIVVGFQPELFTASSRLLNGGGRSR